MDIKKRRLQASAGGAIGGAFVGFIMAGQNIQSTVLGALIVGSISFIMEFLTSKGIYTRFTIDSKDEYEEEQDRLEKEFYDSMKSGLQQEKEPVSEEFEV